MTSQSDEIDDFFGYLTSDDGFNERAEINETKVVDLVGMQAHDIRAREENYRNIGYLEAYDSTKEVRLQDGFETGYKDCIKESIEIGEYLGQIATLTQFSPKVKKLSSSQLHKSATVVKELLLLDFKHENDETSPKETYDSRTRTVKRQLQQNLNQVKSLCDGLIENDNKTGGN